MPDARKQKIITDDGELRDDVVDPDGAYLYCSQCGTANASKANFCRKCGNNLEEQEADMAGVRPANRDLDGRKRKRLADLDDEEMPRYKSKHSSTARTQRGSSPFSYLALMIATSLMGLAALQNENGESWTIIPIAIALLAIVGIRSGNRRRETVSEIWVSVISSGFICLLGLSAIISAGSSWAIVPLMIMWIASEGIRSGS
jgi:hypothetical protein